MPSPLKAKRIPLPYDWKSNIVEEKSPRKDGERFHLKRITSAPKTLYIKDGIVLPESPINLKNVRDKKIKPRTPLPLTRVSVPKKAIRRYPLFDHCKSSIKKTELPDVKIQPLASSETSSTVSSHLELAEPEKSTKEPLTQHSPVR